MTVSSEREGRSMNENRYPLISSFDEILEFDRQFWEVTKGLPIRTGSILRVPSSEYSRWGIELTVDNVKSLAMTAEEFRKKDSMEREANGSIGFEEKDAFSSSVRASMARHIGYIVKELLRDMDDGKREFNICNIATGSGQACSSVANAIRTDSETEGILGRTVFHLVDYSGLRLQSARSGLLQFGPKSVRTYNQWDEEFLSEAREMFDIVISICHFHKNPFPDVFSRIYEKIAEKGALVSGDWHSVLCDHPYFVYKLLDRIGVEDSRLDAYRRLFGDLLNPVSCPDMMDEEIKALGDHQAYWADVYKRMLSQSSLMRTNRHYILGAFDTTRNRLKKLEDAGFVVDRDMIRKAFPNASPFANPKPMTGESDRASVITAIRNVRRVGAV